LVGIPRSGIADLSRAGTGSRPFDDFLDMFERVHLVPERFIDAGDAVVVPNSAELRGRDGIQTVARSTWVYEVRGGRIVRVRFYRKTADALEAAGLRE
jgi:ketosteroid isomerase-like protein